MQMENRTGQWEWVCIRGELHKDEVDIEFSFWNIEEAQEDGREKYVTDLGGNARALWSQLQVWPPRSYVHSYNHLIVFLRIRPDHNMPFNLLQMSMRAILDGAI